MKDFIKATGLVIAFFLGLATFMYLFLGFVHWLMTDPLKLF